MTFSKTVYDKTKLNLALEASIHIGLAILLTTACLVILRPFIPLLSWGIVIAVAAYPGFQKLQRALGGRGALTSILLTVLALVLLIIPVVLLAGTLVEGVQTLTAHFKEGTLIIPPPPAGIEAWPIIGAPLNSLWSRASQDLSEAVIGFAPQIKAAVPGLLSVSAGLGLTVLQFAISIVVAGVLLANAQAAYEVTSSLCNRIFGDKGPEFQQLVGATIRSVTTGHSWRGGDPIGSRGPWVSCGRTAWRRLVGCYVSNRRCATDGGARPYSRGYLYVRDIEHYQSRDFPGLVHRRCPGGQFPEASPAGPRRRSSNGRGVPRRNWRIRCVGPRRLVRRRYRSIGWL